jgi:hypothetical protein
MGVLSEKERDGLEDVFLSIHSHHDKYDKLKNLASLILYNGSAQKLTKLLKQAKYGIKETDFSQFFMKKVKKKKNLSK